MNFAALENKALSNAVLADCRVLPDNPPAPNAPLFNLEEYTGRVFDCMRRLYSSHYYTHLSKPIVDAFDIACMEESILQTNSQNNPPTPGSVEHHLAVCKRYNQFKSHNRLKKADGETINQMDLLKQAVEPLITEAASTLLAEFTRWVTTLKFTSKNGMRGFLNNFEKEMSSLPYLYTLRWPKDIFASFRVDFLMRDDFRNRFPCKFMPYDSKANKFPEFTMNFAHECLIGITVLDNEEAMKKFLRLASNWHDDEDGLVDDHYSVVAEVIEHCLYNNAHKCLGCITRDVIAKYHGGYDHDAMDPVGLTFPAMFNLWCDIQVQATDRSFGYVGRPRWDCMTSKTFDAVYKHALAQHNVMRQPPLTCALRSRWVLLARWGKVRALVRARCFIVQVMQQLAERECHAEFDEDGNALMLGAAAREGRAANASLLGGEGVESRIDERVCVVRGATSDFNTKIQSTLDLVQASRLRRLAAAEEKSSSSDEEEEPPVKRVRMIAIVEESDSD